MFRYQAYLKINQLKVCRRFFTQKITNDPLISVEEAYDFWTKKNSVFIDVRDHKDYEVSHIPGAKNANEIFTYLATSDSKGKEELKNHFEMLFRKIGLTGNEHVITYEDSLKTRFGASCRGYYLLNLLGHKNVNVLDGGWQAWVKAKYPTTNELPAGQEGTFQAKWVEEIYAGQDDIVKALNDPNSVIVDVRDYDEWKGTSSSPYGVDFTPRKGRIAGAVHLLWKDLMKTVNDVTTMKDPQEIKEICNSKGISPDKNVIIYCFKGARASNTFIAFKRAGFGKVKNYFASWNEWSRNGSLPIDSKLL
jgi:thiosulfate/3-mercaptopyruvate sulfurtransferase